MGNRVQSIEMSWECLDLLFLSHPAQTHLSYSEHHHVHSFYCSNRVRDWNEWSVWSVIISFISAVEEQVLTTELESARPSYQPLALAHIRDVVREKSSVNVAEFVNINSHSSGVLKSPLGLAQAPAYSPVLYSHTLTGPLISRLSKLSNQALECATSFLRPLKMIASRSVKGHLRRLESMINGQILLSSHKYVL